MLEHAKLSVSGCTMTGGVRGGTVSTRVVLAQSWEERERLSKLYEEERAKNLSSVTRIQSVMQVRGWVS